MHLKTKEKKMLRVVSILRSGVNEELLLLQQPRLEVDLMKCRDWEMRHQSPK